MWRLGLDCVTNKLHCKAGEADGGLATMTALIPRLVCQPSDDVFMKTKKLNALIAATEKQLQTLAPKLKPAQDRLELAKSAFAEAKAALKQAKKSTKSAKSAFHQAKDEVRTLERAQKSGERAIEAWKRKASKKAGSKTTTSSARVSDPSSKPGKRSAKSDRI